jgi:hypothetical protein
MGCGSANAIKIKEVSLAPSQVDLRFMDGTSGAVEFLLLDYRGDAVDLSEDDVVFSIKESLGGLLRLQKTNHPEDHSDAVDGRTRFDIDTGDIALGTTVETTWVYEVRRIEAAPSTNEAVHIIGKFFIDPAIGV